MKKVLIFPCATEVAIEYWAALRTKKDIKIFGATSNLSDHSEFLYRDCSFLPVVNEVGFLSSLNNLIEKLKIELVIPTHVTVIDFFAENSSKIKCKQLIQSIDTTRSTRSKKMTYKILGSRPYCPTIFVNDFEYDEKKFYFVKTDNGTGGIGGREISTRSDFEKSVKNDELVVCEYLPGDEITVDCFSDENSRLSYFFPRFRSRIRMGTSFRSEEMVCMDEKNTIHNHVSEISNIFNLKGAWFCQFKKDQTETWKLLEVEPRLSGSSCINRINGVNLAYLNVLNSFGVGSTKIFPVSIAGVLDRRTNAKFQSNLTFDAVYIDFDDTIIVRGKLQTDIIKFLFQCVNKGCYIALLTKSLSPNLNNLLVEKKILQLFDEIIHLAEQDTKSNYIDVSKKPIFIDDSFSQRKAVSEDLGIPVFDPDMIEALIEDNYV